MRYLQIAVSEVNGFGAASQVLVLRYKVHPKQQELERKVLL
jgi:hypothetical protein